MYLCIGGVCVSHRHARSIASGVFPRLSSRFRLVFWLSQRRPRLLCLRPGFDVGGSLRRGPGRRGGRGRDRAVEHLGASVEHHADHGDEKTEDVLGDDRVADDDEAETEDEDRLEMADDLVSDGAALADDGEGCKVDGDGEETGDEGDEVDV